MHIVQCICKWVFQNTRKENWGRNTPKMPSTIIRSSLCHVSWSFCQRYTSEQNIRTKALGNEGKIRVHWGASPGNVTQWQAIWHAMACSFPVRTHGHAWIVFPWSLPWLCIFTVTEHRENALKNLAISCHKSIIKSLWNHCELLLAVRSSHCFHVDFMARNSMGIFTEVCGIAVNHIVQLISE